MIVRANFGVAVHRVSVGNSWWRPHEALGVTIAIMLLSTMPRRKHSRTQSHQVSLPSPQALCLTPK